MSSLQQIWGLRIPHWHPCADCQYNQTCNEDLKGLTSLQVLDRVVAAAADRGLYIMFDMHSFEPDAYQQNGLWSVL